jgi:hypothetical protein
MHSQFKHPSPFRAMIQKQVCTIYSADKSVMGFITSTHVKDNKCTFLKIWEWLWVWLIPPPPPVSHRTPFGSCFHRLHIVLCENSWKPGGPSFLPPTPPSSFRSSLPPSPQTILFGWSINLPTMMPSPTLFGSCFHPGQVLCSLDEKYVID